MNNIWETLPRPFSCLAPMEGVTDIVFRQVIARAGRPDLFFTEFTNVSSYASEKGRANALERLEIAPTDDPIIAQIWGKNPDHFAMLAEKLASLGFSGLDINMGCPDRHVNAAGGGAAMIRTPDLAVKCIKKAKAATSLPVSVKTRLGYTYPEEFRDWLPIILGEHPAALTVHLRTKKEMSKVPAHYELIPEIVTLRDTISPATKLIINGDIKNLGDGVCLCSPGHKTRPERPGAHPENMKQTTTSVAAESVTATPKETSYQDPLYLHPGVDGYMIGRGVFENPYCFTSHTPTREDLLDLFHLHLDLFDEYQAHITAKYGHTPSFEPLKHYFKIYINHFPGASELRARLMLCHSTAEVRAILAH